MTARARHIATIVLLILVSLLAASPAPAAPMEILPFSEVEVGMKGTGRTVFKGSELEEFRVEIIGTMENILPKKNLILARLEGGPLAQTGIMEGMSGSPVFIDGRLVGAVAYSWGFAKEPICGITPIEEMLELLERNTAVPEHARRTALENRSSAPADLSLLVWPDKVVDFFREEPRKLLLARGAGVTAGLTPLRPTLSFSGYRPGLMREWFPLFEQMNLRPVIAGRPSIPSRGAAGSPAGNGGTALEPGSAFGVAIVRGDLDVTAIGTVTYVDGDKIIGLGHPFMGMGPTAMPMTSVHVFGYFPSLFSSFKLAGPLDEIGAITQDRFPGVAGVTGKEVAMVPVRVEINRADGEPLTYRFDIVSDPLITPGFLYVSLLNLLAADEKSVGDITLKMREGSIIHVSDDLDVQLENLFSGDLSAFYASGTVAYMTYLLMNNDDRASRIEGINLLMDYEDRRRVARIEKIWLEKHVARPGESLPLHVQIRPFRGERQVLQIPLEIPPEAAEGKVLLQVGDSLTLSRMEAVGGSSAFFPRSLEHLVWLLNNLRSNQKVYATVIRPDTGAIIAGERLPNLPPSVSSILLQQDTQRANPVRVRFRALLEENVETEYVIRGYQKALLEIRR